MAESAGRLRRWAGGGKSTILPCQGRIDALAERCGLRCLLNSCAI